MGIPESFTASCTCHITAVVADLLNKSHATTNKNKTKQQQQNSLFTKNNGGFFLRERDRDRDRDRENGPFAEKRTKPEEHGNDGKNTRGRKQ